MSPIFRVPCFSAPPNTPPCRLFNAVPGLLMSKLLAIKNNGFSFGSGFEISMSHNSASTLSRFTPCNAETGMIGESSATVPLTNSLMSF